MWVDKAREDKLSAGVDHLGPGGSSQFSADPRDRFPFAPTIRPLAGIRGDDLAVFDQQHFD